VAGVLGFVGGGKGFFDYCILLVKADRFSKALLSGLYTALNRYVFNIEFP
jgi:hypothetical protein